MLWITNQLPSGRDKTRRMLPLRAPAEDKREVTASQAAAEEASEETAVVAVLSQKAGALNAFLG